MKITESHCNGTRNGKIPHQCAQPTQLWKWAHDARKWLVLLLHLRGNRLHSPLRQCVDWSNGSFCLCTLSPIDYRSSPSTHCKFGLDDSRFWLALLRYRHSKWPLDCPNHMWVKHLRLSDATKPNQHAVDGTIDQQLAQLLCVKVLHQEFATPNHFKNEEKKTLKIFRCFLPQWIIIQLTLTTQSSDPDAITLSLCGHQAISSTGPLCPPTSGWSGFIRPTWMKRQTFPWKLMAATKSM